MRTCAEETVDANQRTVCCCVHVVPGLPHCREHALARLNHDREREAQTLERMKDRAAILVERELELALLLGDQARDRQAVLSLREGIVGYRDAIARDDAARSASP